MPLPFLYNVVLFAQKIPKKKVSHQGDEMWSTIILIFELTILFVLVAIAYYIVAKIKKGIHEKNKSYSEHLTEFQGAHEEGEITRDEFQKIRKHLAGKIAQETKEKE
ncbi:MAG: hypothetical protein FWC50_16030 [Planctomycetaceae bacterium]|nr:hypothetical protein [Planctomycetaceae bacterium]